jgi:hypothetical protein
MVGVRSGIPIWEKSSSCVRKDVVLSETGASSALEGMCHNIGQVG